MSLVLAVFLATANQAHGHERGGLFWGFSLGGGRLSCDGCSARLLGSGEVHGALMLGERSAVVVEAQVMAHPNKASDELYGFGVAAQRWVRPNVWLKLGTGATQFLPRDSRPRGDFETGLTILGAVGVELLKGTRATVDIQGRFATTQYDGLRVNAVSIQFGLDRH